MKTVTRIFRIIALLLCASVAEGQAWQWVSNPVSYGAAQITQTLCMFSTTDNTGSLILCGHTNADSVNFGQPGIQHGHSLSCGGIGNPVQTFIVKYDTAGNALWARASIGGNSMPLGVITDPSDNIYLYGSYENCDSFGFYPHTRNPYWYPYSNFNVFYLSKFDPLGNLSWIRYGAYLGVTGGTAMAAGEIKNGGIGVDAAGYIYVSGASTDSFMYFGGQDTLAPVGGVGVFLAKYGQEGTLVWAKKLSGSADVGVRVMKVMSNGDIFLCGEYMNGTLSLGNFTLPDPGYYNSNIFYSKLDSSGAFIWVRYAAGYGTPFVSYRQTDILGLAVDGNENSYITGAFTDSLIFDTTKLVNTGPFFNTLYPPLVNAYLAMINPDGNLRWTKILGTQGYSYYSGDIGQSISLDNCNNIWVSGNMDTNIVIDGNVLYAPANRWLPIFAAKFDTNANVLDYFTMRTGGYSEITPISDSELSTGGLYLTGNAYLNTTFMIGADTVKNAGLFITKFNSFCQPAQVRENRTEPKVLLYPNPASDQFVIKCSGTLGQSPRAELYNITGQLVYTTSLKSSETTISTATLLPGMYICKITLGDQAIITRKVLIEK